MGDFSTIIYNIMHILVLLMVLLLFSKNDAFVQERSKPLHLGIVCAKKGGKTGRKINTDVPISTVLASREPSLQEDKEDNSSISLEKEHEKEYQISFIVYGEPIPLSRHMRAAKGYMYNPSAKQQQEFAGYNEH